MTKQQHPITPPFFAVCATESVRYRRTDIQNYPVNLSLCKHIAKDMFNQYPDNIGMPTIKFVGCDCFWIYNKEEDRNEDFDRIVRIFQVNYD